MEVVELGLAEAGYFRLEQRLKRLLARRRHGGERAAVKSAFEGDDFESAVLVFCAVFPRELDGALVGLRAGIGEEDLIEAAVLDQRFRKLQARTVVEGGTRRQQQPGLRGERFRNGRRRMAERVDGPALHEVEIALAGVVR